MYSILNIHVWHDIAQKKPFFGISFFYGVFLQMLFFFHFVNDKYIQKGALWLCLSVWACFFSTLIQLRVLKSFTSESKGKKNVRFCLIFTSCSIAFGKRMETWCLSTKLNMLVLFTFINFLSVGFFFAKRICRSACYLAAVRYI